MSVLALLGVTAGVQISSTDRRGDLEAQQHEDLFRGAAEKEWKWATGDGSAWLKERYVDVQQCMRNYLANKGISSNELSDEQLMAEYVKMTTRDVDDTSRPKKQGMIHAPIDKMVQSEYWDLIT